MHVEDIERAARRTGCRAWLLVQFGADTAEESGGTAQPVRRVADRAEGLRPGPDRDREEQAGGRARARTSGRSAKAASAPPRSPAARTTGRAGKTPRSRRANSAGYVCELRALVNSSRVQGRHVRALRPGLHPLPVQLRPAHRRRDRQLPRVHGAGGRPGRLLRRHPVRRARRRPAAGRTAGEAVRPGARPGDARVQAHLGPGVEDEPWQGRRPVPDGREPQAGHRLQPAAPRHQVRLPARTRATSRMPRCAAWASASAATRRAHPPCAPVTRSPARRSTAPGAAPGCCSRCCGARSSPTAGSREEVFDALDLCLACKGCTNDCPVSVDMPTYKSEFLYHHYKSPRRWRPQVRLRLRATSTRRPGSRRWCRNWPTSPPRPRACAGSRKLAAGIDQRRPLPEFAPMTLQAVVQPARRHCQPVRAAGGAVPRHVQQLPAHRRRRGLRGGDRGGGLAGHHAGAGTCAAGGRYTTTASSTAPGGTCARSLTCSARTCATVSPSSAWSRAAWPSSGTSCAGCCRTTTTRGGWPAMPTTSASSSPRSASSRPAWRAGPLLWGHCHHRATGGMEPEHKLLEQMGLSVSNLQGGCCGLAGSWGFENGKYDISMDCGEQALLPAVRKAPPDTVIVADGFSCKTQIADAAHRPAGAAHRAGACHGREAGRRSRHPPQAGSLHDPPRGQDGCRGAAGCGRAHRRHRDRPPGGHGGADRPRRHR